jgi:VIT1/CCC1 family predicted Fe2+/Mn2+ transporter
MFTHRRLSKARSEQTLDATARKDNNLSIEHQHPGARYVGETVYGGLDGVITTFAVVSGSAGADLGARVIVILGLANILADGFAMGTGAFLAARSHKELCEEELRRELAEIERFPDAAREELADVYRAQGYSQTEIESLLEVETKTPERWARAMMADKVGLARDDRNPLLIGLTTFCSFAIAGFIPLLAFIYGVFHPMESTVSFWITLALCAATLFALGAAKVFVTGLSVLRSGLEVLGIGGLAGAVAYAVGYLLRNFNQIG